MGLVRKLRNREAIEHIAQGSQTHKRHVKERTRQKRVRWFAEEVSGENPAAVFALQSGGLDLDNGKYYRGIGDLENEITGEQATEFLFDINKKRSWNYANMKRGDKISRVKRKRHNPACSEIVVNFSPAQMHYFNVELARWKAAGIPDEKRRELLLAFIDPIRKAIVADFVATTGWEVPVNGIHFDSNKVHVFMSATRVNADNEIIPNTHAYIGTIGGWSVGQARLTQLGMAQGGDNRLGENLARFKARHGQDREPVDLRLHLLLDQEFDKLVHGMGDDAVARYESSKCFYRNWKNKARQGYHIRTATGKKIVGDLIRMFTPLFPPPVRSGIAVCRNVLQSMELISKALDAISENSAVSHTKERQINKTL